MNGVDCVFRLLLQIVSYFTISGVSNIHAHFARLVIFPHPIIKNVWLKVVPPYRIANVVPLSLSAPPVDKASVWPRIMPVFWIHAMFPTVFSVVQSQLAWNVQGLTYWLMDNVSLLTVACLSVFLVRKIPDFAINVRLGIAGTYGLINAKNQY